MDVNIYDYVQRWAINYIVYHSGHLREYGDAEEANSLFSAQYQEAISKMRTAGVEANISSIQAQMQSQTSTAANGLRILSDLQIGTLLDSTLDEIAAGINEGIDLAGGAISFDNYNAIIQQAGNFSNLFASGQADTERVNSFFNLIVEGLSQANAININVLDALTQIGNQLVGTSFQIDKNIQNTVLMTNDIDIQTAQKVIASLNRAVQKLNENGIVSSRSFANTISYIFRQVIGNRISQLIVAEGINIGVNTTDTILNNFIIQSGRKLQWSNKEQNNISNSKGVVKVFNNDTFNLQVTKNNQTFNIEIGTNINAKWQNKKQSQNQISISANMSVGNYFSEQPEKYLAYNMIAHRFIGPDFEQAFNNIRATVAATFFNDWIQQGEFASTRGHFGQFLIVNGKIFSIQRIINNICDDILRNNAHDIISIGESSSIGNRWQGNSGPNILDAITRSNIVNGVISKMVIAATLNNNILSKYAY